MKTQNEWLNAVAVKLSITSDYALANALKTTKQAMSNYRNDRRLMDNYTASRIAEILEVNPMQVIADIELQREKDVTRRDWWSVYSKRFDAETVRGIAPILGVGMSAIILLERGICILC